MTRRELFEAAAATAGLPTLHAAEPAPATQKPPEWMARWIWYPEQRTIQNTFILFRKVFDLPAKPSTRVDAWVSGDSRYMLWVNGQFVQRGPAPSDPRYWDVDPVDIGPYLKTGPNVIAALVLFYGGGDGTWVPSSPLGSGDPGGFLFQCDELKLATDSTWKSSRPRAWKHGAFQRWFLRSLTEEFDARRFPEGWLSPEFNDKSWRAAKVNRAPAGRPNLASLPKEGWHDDWRLHARSIPPIIEELVLAKAATQSAEISWRVPPEEYFEAYTADAFTEKEIPDLKGPLPLRVPIERGKAVAVTFDLGRELSGHHYVKLRAPAGTVVDILFCENQAAGKLLLRTNPKFGQWLRVVCRDGVTEYEAFEYESFRFLQLHLRNASGPVEILAAGAKQRNYAWAHLPDLKCQDAAIQRVFEASVNTHKITSQETLVDNVVRERQQYAGDLDHAKLGSYYGFGETRQPARMLRTFSQGQSAEGWFPDSWPAWDRCQRLYQKHLGLTTWGPIIDHALQFGIASAEHFLWTGDKELLSELTPRMELFDSFLQRNAKPDGLLPVEDREWIWNSIWIDHIGFQSDIDKHAALNIYWAGFLTAGLARLFDWTGQGAKAAAARQRAARILERVRERYWSEADQLIVDNLPRRTQDGATRVHARTLSMAILFGAIPAGKEKASLDLLASFPTATNESVVKLEGGRIQLGANYPLNDIWRLWALGRHGRGAAIVKDLRERYSNLPSVRQNATFAEFWTPGPSETGQVWCQANPVPIIALYGEVLGVRPIAPAFREYEVRPQPADLSVIEGTVHAPQGPIKVRAEGQKQGFGLRLAAPPRAQAWLVVPDGARVNGLPPGATFEPGRVAGVRRAGLPVSEKEQSWSFVVQSV